jgi:thymidylate synthase
MTKYLQYSDFEHAFLGINSEIIANPEYRSTSRLGDMLEIQSLTYEVANPTTYKFTNENIGRLDYNYADTFYQWMISGSTDNEILLKEYPNVARFMEKPKSPDLPANFNTFYGPRILEQLPHIIKELKDHPDTRRAVISILDKSDALLLDKPNETLEFPCCDSATFSIREGKLNIHLHMRSQNMGQVLKLDMYLWGRFQTQIAEELNLPVGRFTSTVVSAHVFEKDVTYLNDLIAKFK